MRFQGKITKWNDEKGFGFILPDSGGKEVFLHISSFQNRQIRPQVSELVSYQLAKDASGRERAILVAFNSQSKQLKRHIASDHKLNSLFIGFMALFFVFILERAYNGLLPAVYVFVFLAANLFAFLYYYIDKTAAIKGNWRKSEDSLHILSLLGGWGGAYIAQKLFRHKYKKPSFLAIYKTTVFLNCMMVIFYSVPELASYLNI